MQDVFQLLPKNHFGPTMDQVITKLLTGQSVCVYGMPGSGRIYFLKIAQQVLEEKLGQRNVFYFTIPLTPKHFVKEITKTLTHQLGFKTTLPFTQQLEVYLHTNQIAIIIAQAESLLSTQPEVFTFLDRLRDLYRNRLSILTSNNYSIINNFRQYAHFGDTIFSNLVLIPTFDVTGTKRILLTNSAGLPINPTVKVINKIHYLSGGNAALIKYLGSFFQKHGESALGSYKLLLSDPGLQIKLNDIAEIVLTETQETLYQLGIIKQDGKIFSPLLLEFLKHYETENLDEIILGLTGQEKKILTYLLKNKGKLLDKDRLAMLMKLTDETYSLWAMYQAISRLKKKVKGKYQIKTLKGQGYILVDPKDTKL